MPGFIQLGMMREEQKRKFAEEDRLRREQEALKDRMRQLFGDEQTTVPANPDHLMYDDEGFRMPIETRTESQMNPFLRGMREAMPEEKRYLVDAARNNPEIGQMIIKSELAHQGRSPFSSPVMTAKGVYGFDHRTGTMKLLADAEGNPVVDSKSDPLLQREISAGRKFGEEAGKEASKSASYETAFDSLSNAKRLLNSGIYTGKYADFKLALSKGSPFAGKETAARTEEFISHLGGLVIPMMEQIGGNDTEQELNYMKNVVGGNISMEPQAIGRVLDSFGRKLEIRRRRAEQNAGISGLRGVVAKPPEKPKVKDPLGIR